MPSANPPAAHVANEAITAFGSHLPDQVIFLTTPVPKLVPMSKFKLSSALRALIDAWEPRLQGPACTLIRRSSSVRSRVPERSTRIG